MELKQLTEKMIEILKVEDTNDMSEKLFEVVKNNDIEAYKQFCDLVENDLSRDWLQMIFQYYHADRKDKMQDYTPKTVAEFMSLLVGDNVDTIIDMCAGSGALTIQKWNMNNNIKFELYELDTNVIPFLLFNMEERNIECTVYNADILQQEIINTYKIEKGDKFGIFKEVENEHSFNFKSTI